MRKTTFSVTGTLLALAFLSVAAAGEPPLTLREAVRLALENEEEVRLAMKNLEEARAQRTKAIKSMAPDVALSSSWGYTRLEPEPGAAAEEGDEFGYTLSLNQPLYTGGRATSAMRQAGRTVDISARSYDLAGEEVCLLTAQSFLDALTAAKVVEAGEEGMRQAKAFLDLVRTRYELGEVTLTSVLRAEFELAKRENELVQARNARALARESLKRFIGRDFGELAAEGQAAEEPPGDLEALIGKAMTARKELLNAADTVEIAREGVVSARGKFLPVLSANGHFTRTGEEFLPREKESWGVSLNLTVPIYDRGWSSSDLALAKIAVEKSELQRERLRKDIRLEVEDAWYRLESLRSSTASLRKQVELAGENRRGVEKQYQLGLSTDLDVTTALSDLLSARVQLAREESSLLLARLRLLKTTGSGLAYWLMENK